jgi:putative addiction module component (TIGR02574 family)
MFSFDFRQLSVPDRIELIGQIWDSIEAEQPVVPLSEAQRAEIRRRLDDREKNPDDWVSWEEIKAEYADGSE